MSELTVIQTATLTASGKVSEVPCLVYSICGIGIADTNNVYSIHNGQGTDGKRIMRLVAGSYSADFRLFACPLHFTKGLYVDFTVNGSEVFVQFLQIGL